jgi:hypothetical protein
VTAQKHSSREVTVRLDDLAAALDAAQSNPYLFDGEDGTEWLTRLEAVVEQAKAVTAGDDPQV